MFTQGYLVTVLDLAPERFLAFGVSTLLVWSSICSVTQFGPRLGWVVGNLSIGVLFIRSLRLIQSLSVSGESIITTHSSLQGISRNIRAQTLKLIRVLATRRCFIAIYLEKKDGSRFYTVSRGRDLHTTLRTPTAAFEYAILRLLALLGRRFLVSAEDLRVFYLALELQSLALYVLAASARGSAYSTEAGLKYFRLGAFASGLYLLGASLIYGYLGTTNYTVIGQLLSIPLDISNISQLNTGFLLILAAISFKLAAAPFHRWSPDVREGSPSTSGRFFASVTKIAALGGLIRLCFGPFYGIWRGRLSVGFAPIAIRSGLSRRVGALAALGQRRRKRFLAYSAIGHRGFRLRGFASGTLEGVQATRRYLILYVIGTLGIWSVVVSSGTQFFTDLGGLSRRQPALARVIAISMFSRAGVPPRGGFLAKLSVLSAARESSRVQTRYSLAIVAILASVIGAYYYLRVIKIRYFAAPIHHNENDKVGVFTIGSGAAWVRALSSYITVFVLLHPTLLSILVQRATLSILIALLFTMSPNGD